MSGLDPQSKVMKYGVGALTDEELLALIIRCGTRDKPSLILAKELLGQGRGFSDFMQSDLTSLMKISGIGQAKAVELLAVIEIAKRVRMQQSEEKITLDNPASIADYFMGQMRYLNQEHLYVCLFDTRCHYIGQQLISIGTIDMAVFSPREIFREAIKRSAASIVLLHNHPSGDPEPSDSDCEATRQCVIAGAMLGIQVLDHIIIGDNNYYSFMKNGQMKTAGRN